MLFILKIYLIISVLVAIFELCGAATYESYLSDVPEGDLEYYSCESSLINPCTIIFFPSLIVIGIWIGIVSIINAILDLF